MLGIDYKTASMNRNSKHENRETNWEAIAIIQMSGGCDLEKDDNREPWLGSGYTWNLRLQDFLIDYM